jgi:hypothetical protein
MNEYDYKSFEELRYEDYKRAPASSMEQARESPTEPSIAISKGTPVKFNALSGIGFDSDNPTLNLHYGSSLRL